MFVSPAAHCPEQVHCTYLPFWALGMQPRCCYCTRTCPCLLWLYEGHVRLDSSMDRNDQFCSLSSSLTINQLHVSPAAAWSDCVPPLGSLPLHPVTPPLVCCCLGSPAWAQTHSGSYASAACWLYQRTSSCTGVAAGSTQRDRRLPCCKSSTWRQFPSGDW